MIGDFSEERLILGSFVEETENFTASMNTPSEVIPAVGSSETHSIPATLSEGGADLHADPAIIEGILPTANVVKIDNITILTVTDRRGVTTSQILDGTDGHSPVITAQRSGTKTIIYSDGVAIAEINDGEQGPAGTTSWNGITDKPTEFPPEAHNHDDRYYTESESDGKYITLATEQEASAKKIFGYTEPLAFGGQETIVKILSTRKSTDMSTRMWAGRMMVGTEDKSFLMGVYKCTSSPICGIGAHSWSSARKQTGPAWEDVYIQPDGNKAVYLGGFEWNANGGWIKVQNSNQNTGGKAYYNKGSITSPDWKELATIEDITTAIIGAMEDSY